MLSSKIKPEDLKKLFQIKRQYGHNENASDAINDLFSSSQSNTNSEYIYLLQEALVDSVLRDPILAKYKPYKKYRISFLKSIISKIEKINEEVHEELFNCYINLINESEEQELYYMVLYDQDLDDEKPIIFEQFQQVISNGTTGLHVWPAAFQLLQFLKANKDDFKDKQILELGAGCGLLGLQCIRKCQPKHYVFTDSHHLVLKQIMKNLKLNYGDIDTDSHQLISVKELNWQQLDECDVSLKEKMREIDVILASDIVFDKDIIPDLVQTLKFIWSVQKTNIKLYFLICSTIRNQDTYNTFLKCLDLEKFEYQVVDRSSTKNSSTSECLIETLKVFRS